MAQTEEEISVRSSKTVVMENIIEIAERLLENVSCFGCIQFLTVVSAV